MSVSGPRLTSGGPVRIRIRCGELGTTKWREGVFEIHERDNKINLQVKFNSGGAPRMFQLNHNVKQVSWYQTHCPTRMTLTLKDSSVVMMEKMNMLVAKKMREYLEKVRLGKPAVLKTNQGSASFGLVLGNRAAQNDSALSPSDKQTPPRRPSLDSREDGTPRKPLASPSRATATPGRTGLSENRSEKRKRLMTSDGDLAEDYPKENDSSSNNKAIPDASRKFLLSCKEKLKQSEENRASAPHTPAPLQPTSFYGGRSGSKDYTQTHSFLDRPSSAGQCPSAKRSLMLPNHSTPFKKVRPTLDYGGWNKPRPSALAQPQPPLQGFSNLGNTCYMNAILQSLFSLPSFSNDLLKQGIPWKRVPVNALLKQTTASNIWDWRLLVVTDDPEEVLILPNEEACAVQVRWFPLQSPGTPRGGLHLSRLRSAAVCRGLLAAKTQGFPPTSSGVTDALSFLKEQLDKGSSPSMLKIYVVAIAAFTKPASGPSLWKNLVICFLKGAKRMNPPRPPSIPMVLEALKGAPFESIRTSDTKHLSFKTVFLMALESVKHIGDLQALSISSACMEFGPNDSKVILKPRHGYVPKSLNTPYRAQVISLSAVPVHNEEESTGQLCPEMFGCSMRKLLNSESPSRLDVVML
ncbi:ubiquitin carboxyl-terminal hydrolase 37-like [Pimephales promelas]|uniref:ubiquitin carboxyl-terminal hydrolase 37-like n=1 Tax=Pimephales promelas TaxID=90988 RepID=UPI001955E16D|nr:ubiquitin carboxyl-terminal hydrolase 37-like [Pimephales promelas]